MTPKGTQSKAPKVAIIGGGLTGLSLAAQLDRAGIPFLLLEQAPRLGGQIKTLKEKGYTYEVGPNTGTISTPEVAELFEYAAPEAELEVPQAAAHARWIWKDDQFHPIPSGILSGLRTPLYTWKDKLGIPFEPFRKKGTDPNESVGALAERRLGKSVVDYTIDPFIGGIYAGDPYQLVTRLAMPKLYRLEQEYGSFIGGAIRKMREPKSERDKKATKAIFNARGGLTTLVQALEKKIQRTGEVRLGVQEVQIMPLTATEHPSFHVSYLHEGEKQILEVPFVVTTVRADQMPSLFPSTLQPRFQRIQELPYAPITEVCVGFDHLPDVPRAAFGALVPSREQRKVLGILFPSSCFEARGPYPDSALFTIFMGGLRNKELVTEYSLEEQTEMALSELYTMMRIPPEMKPNLIHTEPHAKAIPQYGVEAEKVQADIQSLEAAFPGLYLAGGARDGIGMAHRITQGMQIGQDIHQKLIEEGLC